MGGTCVAVGWWCGGPSEGWFCDGSMVGDGGHRLLSVVVGGIVKVAGCTIDTWVLWVVGRFVLWS